MNAASASAAAARLKAKKYNVWSDVLQERDLCDDLLKVGSFNKDDNKQIVVNRDTESYQLKTDIDNKNKKRRKSRKKNKKRLNNNIYTSKNVNHLSNLNETILNEIKNDYLKSEINQIEQEKELDNTFIVTYDEHKNRDHIKVNEFDSDEMVAKEISRQLYEKKVDLIERCVKTLGRNKSLELLYAAQDIEDAGGMYTEDDQRRRSPGGVYIQLIKSDNTILSVQKKKIFIQSLEEKKLHKRKKRFNQKQRLQREKVKLIEKDEGVNVKNILSLNKESSTDSTENEECKEPENNTPMDT